MGSVIRFSMKNAVALILIIVMIGVGGILSVKNMNIEEFPNIDIPYLGLFLMYPGASAEQSMNDVGKPLTAQLKNVDGVKNIYAEGFANGFYATMQFDMNVRMDDAEREIRDIISKVKLPDSVRDPEFHRQSPTGNLSIYSLGIHSDHPEEIQTFVKDILIPQLEGIKGVDEIQLAGEKEEKLYVKLRPDALEKHNLTIDQVKQAILANNLSVPTGEVTLSNQLLPIRVGKKLQSIDDVKNLNILFAKQDLSALSNSFEAIGDGMKQLGSGMEQLGDGVRLVGEIQGAQQAQLQLLVALQGLSGALIQDQIELQRLQATATANPDAVSQEQIQGLQRKIEVTQAQITELQAQFQQVTDQLVTLSKNSTTSNKDALKSTTTVASTDEEVEMKVNIHSLKLSEIADITFGNPEETNFTRINGQPGMILSIIPAGGANVVSIVKEAKEIMDRNPLPEGVYSEVLRDQSIQIEKSVFDMLKEAILGALMAMVVTLLFLRNLRSTLIAIISIPLSILASFIVLNYLGYTLNLITLSGIAVAVGRVVDDSIVVIENIFRRIRKTDARDEQLVIDSTREVANAITSSTITTVAVFVPLAFVSGIVGEFFAPLAWTIVISLLFSLLVAVTIVPFLARIFLLKIEPVEHREGTLQRIYRKALRWSLGHRVVTLSIAVLLLAASVVVFVPKLGFNFLPQEKVVDYSISIKMPIGTAPEKVNQAAEKAEKLLLPQENIKLINTRVFGASNSAYIDFVLDEDTKNATELIDHLRSQLDAIQDVESISLSGFGSIAGASSTEFVLVVNGPNMDVIQEASELMIDHLKPVTGLADLRTSSQGEKPEIVLKLNEEKMKEHGFYSAMVGANVRNLVSGDTITTVDLNTKSTDLVLGLKMDAFDSIDQIGEQKISNMLGTPIALKEIATFEEVKSPRSITQLNQREYVMIKGTITDANSGAVLSEATKIVSALKLPDGVTWYKEGASEVMNEGFKNMGVALGISILLVYFTMMIAFGEATAPFVILFSIPFSTIGALLGLYVMNQPIGMPAMVGLLMLNGIVVTNAIVLLDRVKQNERKGMSKYDALMEAGGTRLRPILMTAIATMGALTPMMFTSSGSLLSKSLAVVVVGGLMTSTLLTLIIVPVMYSIVKREKNTKNKMNTSVEA